MESTAVGGSSLAPSFVGAQSFFLVAPPLFVVLANRIPLAAKDETRMDWAATSAATSAAISKKEGVAGGNLEDGLWRSNLNLAQLSGPLEAEFRPQ